MTNESKNTILEDYRDELSYALKMKANGATTMSVFTGNNIKEAPIDECIKHWQDGIAAMEAGAEQEQFNY